ncbi:MAG: hypothetical protein ABFC96_16485 [Thermoguttaceae bacterium]
MRLVDRPQEEAAPARASSAEEARPTIRLSVCPEPEVQPALSLSDVFSGVLAALEKSPTEPANGKRTNAARETANVPHVAPAPRTEPSGIMGVPASSPSIAIAAGSWVGDQQWVVGSGHWTPTATEWVSESSEPREPSTATIKPLTDARPIDNLPLEHRCVDAPAARSSTPVEVQPPEARVRQPESPRPETPTVNIEPVAPLAAAPSVFKPAWQVDRFTWPKVCRRLMARAEDEWDRLCEALLAAGSRGQKVLAIAGCHRGEGATTLLLCAASRLAERGIKTALVDADVNRPRLAKRLGIQPQLGWDDAGDPHGDGLGRAMVECATGGLAVLPLCDPAPQGGRKSLDGAQLAACVESLRSHYEMILVDLGPLDGDAWVGGTPAWAAPGAIDALLLACNRRLTPDEELSETSHRLRTAGVPVAGVIENFSRTDEPCTSLTGD